MWILYSLSSIFILTPFLPVIRNPHWFFRTADFIRLQSIAIQALLLLGLFFFSSETFVHWSFVIALILSMAYQVAKIYPYSSWYPRKLSSVTSDAKMSILAANVYQDNRDYDKFITQVRNYDADIVLTMESDHGWEKALSKIEDTYPYSCKIAKDNYYGMHVYSKKNLRNVTTRYQVEEDVPSIFFEYQFSNGKHLFICCLHPAPPSPTENETSKERDAELMLAAQIIRTSSLPSIICGDMNDVVWSRTSRLFKKITNMVDPRIGRGFFSTYYANYWFLRFPLDHLFHTRELFVGKMERTTNFGSDHYGMYYEVNLKNHVTTPANPIISEEDATQVDDLITRAEN